MVKTYTFKVSPVSLEDCWRKIEMTDDQTLETLHNAIQQAFDFDNDHLYSFFMSGKAWDAETQYSLPESEGPFGSLLWMGVDDQTPQDTALLEPEDLEIDNPPDLDRFLRDEISTMTDDPAEQQNFFQTIKAIFEADEATFGKLMQEMTKEVGTDALPLMTQLRMLRSVWEDMMREVERDVRSTTLQLLDLRTRKKFLYLFDYGDEWRFTVQVESINKNAPDAQYPQIVESVGEAPRQYPDWDAGDEMEWEDGEWGAEDAG